MSIERSLAKLQARPNKSGDRVSQPARGVPVIGSGGMKPDGDVHGDLRSSGLMKRTGSASLETGNDFGGMPQVHPELRAVAETVIDLGDRAGDISIDLARANVFKVNLTGNAMITFTSADWPDESYERSATAGLDFSATLLISKGEATLGIAVDYWAPKQATPDLTKAGFFEIAIAKCVVNGGSVTRGYPAIIPA